MLFLTFQLGNDRYALEAGQIVEALPLVRLKRLPHAPAGVAGAFIYHGAPVPVVDLSAVATGRPAAARLSTRLILVNYPIAPGETRVLGLIAENATGTLRREPADFEDLGVDVGRAPYLGPVTREGDRVIQRIEVSKLLPPDISEMLFRQFVEQGNDSRRN
jgi:chemotaxis-related protein WspB